MSEGTGAAIACAPDGSIYAAGWTMISSFVTTPGTVQPTSAGNFDIYVTRLVRGAPAQCVTTLLGSLDMDVVSAIALDESGRVYLSGQTLGAAYPTTPGAYDRSIGRTTGTNSDGLFSVLSPGLDSLCYSTFIGGGLDDYVHDIAVDPAGRVVLCGSTDSRDFPVGHERGGPDGNSRAFVMALIPQASSVVNDPSATALAGNGATIIASRPLPARDRVDVEYDLPTAGALTMTLHAADGTEVLRPMTGAFTSAGRHHATIDVSSLANGVYRLRMTSGRSVVGSAIVVMR